MTNYTLKVGLKKAIKSKRGSMPRPKSYQKLKRDLDQIFSLFIRHRNSKGEYNQCFTCAGWYLIKDLHCGHYVSRTYIGTRWDEKNCQPQCKSCNLFHQGRADEFALALIRIYGPKVLDELAWKKKGGKLSGKELELLIADYENKLKHLN